MTPDATAFIRRRVEAFAERQMQQAPERRRRLMKIKLEHTRFVAQNAYEIAERSALDPVVCCAAEAAGWLHDIARFPQILEYGHFDDRRSYDHGDHGAELITSAGWLPTACAEWNRALRGAVRYHNKKELPDPLPERDLTVLKIIRDADRLDIYRVIYEAVESGEILRHPELHLDCSTEQTLNPKILKQFFNQEIISYRDAHSMLDMQLLKLSWIYIMHCPASLELFRERNLLEYVAKTLPEHPAKKEILDFAQQLIEGVPQTP